MKHALALILACCALVAQDAPAPVIPKDSPSIAKTVEDGRPISRAERHRWLVEQFNTLTESIRQNESAAKNAWTARGIKGMDAEAIRYFDRAYVDFSTLALEQRKLWTQTLLELSESGDKAAR